MKNLKPTASRCLLSLLLMMNAFPLHHAKAEVLQPDVQPQAVQADPFAPFVNAPAPEILRDVGPALNEKSVPAGVIVKRVLFRSLGVPTAEGPRFNEVYAVIARPAEAGTFPGLLVLHGGKGQADFASAVLWAKRGYVAIAPDLPGIGDPATATNSTGLWKEKNYGAGRWKIEDNWNGNAIFQAVVAALQSLSLLKSQPHVDANHVGVTGISWGGYTSTMVAGLAGDGIQAVFSLYGSGHYPNTTFAKDLGKQTPEVQAKWLSTLDASVRAKNIKAPYFVAAASNDVFFYPSAVRDTLNDISAPKGWVLAPNANHQMPVAGGNLKGDVSPLQVAFFDWYLKGQGSALPVVKIDERNGANPLNIRFSVSGAQGEAKVQLYYSLANTQWIYRKWLPVEAVRQTDGSYTAELPVEAGEGSDVFILVSDSRPVSVSSELFRLKS